MADKLYFSRDAKLYVELTSNAGAFQGLWEIPILDGFSFSQSTNQTEIGLSEMESTLGLSRRGRRLFTDSLAPAEWSFSTYIRPTIKNTNEHHLVDEVLWAAMAGADLHAGAGSSENGDFTRNSSDKATATGIVMDATGGTLPSGGTGGLLNFQESNRSTLPKITLYFVFETDTTNPMVYKLSNAIVNECSIDFDIDGIATANWSGFAKEVEDLQSKALVASSPSAPVTDGTYTAWMDTGADNALKILVSSAWKNPYSTGVTSTNNFIRNRLTQLDVRGRNTDVLEGKTPTVTGVSNASDAVVTTSVAHGLKAGDTITISGVVGDGTGDDGLEAAINTTHTVKAAPTTTTFSVEVDTTASDAYDSGGIVATGLYSFTLTGGNITISNNVTYLVPEELGTINKPIEGVTGARAIGGNFTCYLVFDTAGNDSGASADFFSDLVDPNAGLTKVVNDFDVTFKVGGTVAGQPKVFLNFPKVHIDVPAHNIEDVISLETSFGAYTDDFDTVDEFNMEVYGVSA